MHDKYELVHHERQGRWIEAPEQAWCVLGGESPVPDIGRDGGVGVEAAVERGHADAVQVAGGVTSEDHPPGSSVLTRTTCATWRRCRGTTHSMAAAAPAAVERQVVEGLNQR